MPMHLCLLTMRSSIVSQKLGERRAEHPFEEKIRACIKDPNSSVDIADLARYYALDYLKGIRK